MWHGLLAMPFLLNSNKNKSTIFYKFLKVIKKELSNSVKLFIIILNNKNNLNFFRRDACISKIMKA